MSLSIVLLAAALAAITGLLCVEDERGSCRLLRDVRLRKRREAAEDALKCLHDLEYEGEVITAERLGERLGSGPEAADSILEGLQSRGW